MTSADPESDAVSSRKIRLFSYMSGRNNDRHVIARTWQKIGGARMDEVEREVQRLDDDGLEEPLPGPNAPRSGHQGTLLEGRDVVPQSIDNGVAHSQWGL